MAVVADDTVEPVVAPGQTLTSVTDRVTDIVLHHRAGLGWWLCFALAMMLVGLFAVAVITLFVEGIGIWGVNIPVAWGFAIANYVWWIGIASGGTIISAGFYLTRAPWRRSINRIAETMTLFAAACAGIMPILHLGRWYYFYWLFPYPNVMDVWPQFRSPLLWDFVAVLAYIIASILFWYVGLIPDFATMRDHATRPFWRIAYGLLALGWRGDSGQWHHYERGYGLLAALMTPLVISVHSIVGLDFAGGLTPGWHSTQFPPYFVFGALLSGFGIVLMLLVPVRRIYGLEALITERHLDVLGKLALTFSLLLGYSYLIEAFLPFYSGNPYDRAMQLNRFSGEYAGQYWATIICNVLIPQLLWFRAVRLNGPLVFLIGGVIVIGMWLERYIIVVTSLYRDFMPSAWGSFAGTFWDYATLIGTGGIFVGGIMVALRLVPAVSLAEMRQLIAERGERR